MDPDPTIDILQKIVIRKLRKVINVGAEGLFCLKFFTFHFRFTLKVLKVYEKEKIQVVRCE